jgi:hypothetical protein
MVDSEVGFSQFDFFCYVFGGRIERASAMWQFATGLLEASRFLPQFLN